MALRPTPFGVFAGIAIGEWGSHTTLSLSTNYVRTRTRLDMGWLLGIVEELESRREIFRQLRVRANPSLFLLGGRIVLPEQSALEASEGGVRRVSVRATRVVRLILELARVPITAAELMARIHSILPSAPADRIEAALDSLRASSILLTELRPPVTHGQPMAWIINMLHSLSGVQDVLDELEELEANLVRCDAHAGAERAERAVQHATAAAQRVVSDLAGNRPVPLVTPLQVDTMVQLGGSHLPRAVGWEAARAAETLLRCAPKPGTSALAVRLAREIQARYGEWEFVSIPELMADGVLTRIIGAPGADGQFHRADTAGDFAPHNRALVRLATDSLQRRVTTVVLDDTTLDELSQPIDVTRAPPTLEIFVSVVANSARDVDEGRFSLVVGPGIGSAEAGRSLGRFTDMLSPDERDRVRAALGRNTAPDGHCINVELACLPRQPRLANVAIRMVSPDYELSIGTWPGVPEDRVIALRELEIGAPAGQLQLRWARTGQRIRLRQATMLNPLLAPAVCQVLLAASAADEMHLAPFDWGPASGFPFLPRVVRGRSVLRTAEWRVDPRPLLGPAGRARAEASRWLQELGVPQLIHISRGDSRLLVDLGNPDSVHDLVTEARAATQRGNQLTLHEALIGPADAWLRGPNGKHTLELAVQLAVDGHPSNQALPVAAPNGRVAVAGPTAFRRRVWPGEEWAYVKLYLDREQQVEFLLGELQGLIAELSRKGSLASWFFVRYADPDHHIRLRLRTSEPGGGPDLISSLAWWVTRVADSVGLQHVVLEPYLREVHRYGGTDGMGLAERIFHADSVATLGLLSAARSSQVLDPIDVGVLSSSHLLTDLGVGYTRVLSWLPVTADRHPDTGRVYRIRQNEIRALLAKSGPTNPEWKSILTVLDQRREALAPIMAAVAQTSDNEQVTDALARSHVHLHLNRLFGTDLEKERLTLGLLRRALRSIRVTDAAGPL